MVPERCRNISTTSLFCHFSPIWSSVSFRFFLLSFFFFKRSVSLFSVRLPPLISFPYSTLSIDTDRQITVSLSLVMNFSVQNILPYTVFLLSLSLSLYLVHNQIVIRNIFCIDFFLLSNNATKSRRTWSPYLFQNDYWRRKKTDILRKLRCEFSSLPQWMLGLSRCVKAKAWNR